VREHASHIEFPSHILQGRWILSLYIHFPSSLHKSVCMRSSNSRVLIFDNLHLTELGRFLLGKRQQALGQCCIFDQLDRRFLLWRRKVRRGNQIVDGFSYEKPLSFVLQLDQMSAQTPLLDLLKHEPITSHNLSRMD